MYEIPQSVLIDGKEHPIRNKGDFRVILDCFTALEDVELTANERTLACLIIFYEELNSVEDIGEVFSDVDLAVSEMIKFFNCGQTESPGAHVDYKLIDWQLDSQLVCSAINNVAGKEIRAESYLHWWTFMGYYFAVGESPLSTVVCIRNKLARGKKLEKYEMEFKKNNPEYFNIDLKSITQKENDALLKQLWNSGK